MNFDSVKNFVKEHPVGVSVGAVALVAVYIIYRRNGGSGAAANATDPNAQAYYSAQAAAVQAGSQFQVAQLQANQAALQSNNQAAVANNQVTAQEVIAQLQSQDTLAGIAATAQTNQLNIADTATTQQNADTLSAQTTQAVSLLQAQVAENQTAAQVATTQINATAYVDIASLPYDSVTPALYAQLNQATANIATLQGDVNQINTAPGGIGALNQYINSTFGTPTAKAAAATPGFGQLTLAQVQ